MPGKKYIRTSSLLCDAGLPPLDLLLDQASQRYGIRILLYQPPHPLAHWLFESLRAAPAQVSDQGTGVCRIAALLHPLGIFSHLGPSHAAWLSKVSTQERARYRNAPAASLLRHWKTRHPRGDPSPGPPAGLANLRRHQARVIAQWRSRTTSLDAPPWLRPGPDCSCGDIQSSEHALLVCPKYQDLRRGFLAGCPQPVLFDDIVLEELQVFPLLAFLKRAKLFSGSASIGPVLLMDAVM